MDIKTTEGLQLMMVQALARSSPEAGLLRCLDGSRPRVLLAEDSDAARILIAALLRRMGCEVDAVANGEEAFSHVQSFPYDLILLDIEMPIMDGVIAARAIRSLGGAAGATPLMALSAFLADSSKSGHWQETFDIALAKPAGRDELRNAIQRALISKVKRASPPAVAEPQRSTPTDLLIDEAQLARVRAHLSPFVWGELVEAAVSEMRDMLKAIAFALAFKDSNAIIENAHRLKAIGRSFAAPRLAAAAETLEVLAAQRPTEMLNETVALLRKNADLTLAALADFTAKDA